MDKLGQRPFSLPFNATRASVNWAISRVSVRRWALAHFLYKAKHGLSYAAGGPAALRTFNRAMAEFLQLM